MAGINWMKNWPGITKGNSTTIAERSLASGGDVLNHLLDGLVGAGMLMRAGEAGNLVFRTRQSAGSPVNIRLCAGIISRYSTNIL